MPAKQIVCVTIPRSGHHFFSDIIRAYYKDQLFYCFRADSGDCCELSDCSRSDGKLTLKKTHDSRLTVPIKADVQYVLQHRDPIAQLQSFAELTNKANPATFASHISMTWWLAKHASYFRAFLKKWKTVPGVIVLDYESLVSDTMGSITNILSAASWPFDDRLEGAVDARRSYRAAGPTGTGTPSIHHPRGESISPLIPVALMEAFKRFVRTGRSGDHDLDCICRIMRPKPDKVALRECTNHMALRDAAKIMIASNDLIGAEMALQHAHEIDDNPETLARLNAVRAKKAASDLVARN